MSSLSSTEAFPASTPAASQIFTTVLSEGPLTRLDVARWAGLSAAAVTKAVRPLIEAGYLVEDLDADARPALGRPTNLVRVEGGCALFIGVKVSGDEIIGVLTDLCCRIMVARHLPMADRDPGRVLASTVDLVRELLTEADGLGVPDAKGITYAQELVWALFGNYSTACVELNKDTGHGETVAALREKLHLPEVSPTTGWLEEWMSPDNLGETTHRHLSPLVGLFPGDRIRPDGSTPKETVEGATALLTARGMESFGWANAWRALCWARLKNADHAYQAIVNNLRPSVGGGNGTAFNLFDIYEADKGRGIFQIDANFGTPAAISEMLLYSRPGHLELLPALLGAWAASGSVTGLAARGGFVVDLRWKDGKPTSARIPSTAGRSTTVAFGDDSRTVRLEPGESVTLKGFGR